MSDPVPAGAAAAKDTSSEEGARHQERMLSRKASFLSEVEDFVWIPDSTRVWQLAKKILVEVSGDEEDASSDGLMVETKKFRAKEKCIRCQPVGTEQDISTAFVDVPEKDLLAYDASHSLDLNDLATMNNMHEAPLLDLLRRRYADNKIYTYSGNMLLSINPFRRIPDLADEEANKDRPHLFGVANKAYEAMTKAMAEDDAEKAAAITGGFAVPMNQSIVISGESGAGKTEAAKIIMSYLVRKQKSRQDADLTKASERIAQCVLEANPALEAFGNAKTVRNDNSSRFGKYVQMKYGINGEIVGAHSSTFLLEKSRIVAPDENERNFHILYQICSASTLQYGEGSPEENIKEKFKILDSSGFKSLARGNCLTVDSINDQDDFAVVMKCMESLNFSNADVMDVIKFLVALLHMGNLAFTDETVDQMERSKFKYEVFNGVETAFDLSLDDISGMLGVESSTFSRALRERVTQSGRGSVMFIPMNATAAKDQCDAFCKAAFEGLFLWLVERVNECMKADLADCPEGAAFIGILDIVGFEMLQQNSLEQLCFNLANEMLQQQFNHHVFETEQQKYMEEGIDWTKIEYQNNDLVIELIQKPPTGILIALDELSRLGRGATTNGFLSSLDTHHKDKHPNYKRGWHNTFTVEHFAGSVVYDSTLFLSKNSDSLNDDLIKMMRNSENAFAKMIFSPAVEDEKSSTSAFSKSRLALHAAGDGGGGGGRRRGASKQHSLMGSVTVSSVFRSQLQHLKDMLWSTSPHHVKCIKPNSVKQPGGFTAEMVLTQLRYSGVLEVVRIRREGYPVNLSFKEFVERFEYLVPAEMRHLTKDPDKHREVTAKVLQTFLAADQKGDQFQIGNTKVYLKDNMLETLDGEGRSLLKRAARTLQKRVRMRQARAHYVESKKASLKMQNLARILGARRNVRREKASIMMQSAARARLARKAYIAEMTELARLEQLRLEAERVERARLAELARLEQLRLAKLETERLAAEKKEAERLEAERVEMERREALAAQMGAKKRLERANKMLQNTISRKREEKRERCALRIQSTMRMIPHRYALRRGLAATKIQAISRMVPRKWDRTQLKASTRMQASVRRYQERCRYLKTQEGIRQENARLEALRRNNASIKMQSAARARRARKAYIAEIASRKLQANLPVLHARRNLNIATQQLFAAVKSGDTSGAMYILKNRPFLQEVRNRKDRFKTLFHTAAEHNMPEIIGKIGGLSTATVWLKDADGNTPFHLACAKGSLDLMKEMADTCNLKDGDDVHTRASRKTISESILDDEQTTSKRAKQRASISTKIASMFKKDHAVGMKSGKLKRKRPNGPWKERWAELQNDKLVLYHTQNSPSPCYVLSLAKTIVKNSQTHERTFEIYSAELLDDKRNEQGLLLFQAPTEIEKQSWLTDVRAALPEDVLFKGYHQFANDKLFHKPRKMNELVAMENKTGETPLHMACKGLPLVEPLTYCHKQTPAILWLLSFGADYKKAIHGSITPLVVAEKKHDEFSKLAAYRDSLDRHMPFTVFTKYIEHEKKKAVRFVQGFVDAPTKKLKAASYLSLFLEKFSLADASNRSDLTLRVSLRDERHQAIEKPQLSKPCPFQRGNDIWWCERWHMPVPLQNVNTGSLIVLEVLDKKTTVCWTAIKILTDDVATKSLPSLDMYDPPCSTESANKKLYEGFLSCQILVEKNE